VPTRLGSLSTATGLYECAPAVPTANAKPAVGVLWTTVVKHEGGRLNTVHHTALVHGAPPPHARTRHGCLRTKADSCHCADHSVRACLVCARA
jgi:hypothetical protein